MANYATISGRARNASARTSQTDFIPGREAEQVRNAAGGVSFKMDDFDRLQRFLILGVEGNTFYQGQRELVGENVECLDRCLKKDGRRVVDMAIEFQRRAFKQDPVLFVLAAAASHTDEGVRYYALSNLHRVARTGYALYRFTGFVKSMRGFGPSLRRAFNRWLTETSIDQLAYQSWKYKQRDGWSMRDIMRLSHPVTDDMVRAEIFRYMSRPKDKNRWNPLLARGKTKDMNPKIYTKTGKVRAGFGALKQIEAAEELLHLKGDSKATVTKAANLITDYRLTHEAVPTNLRKFPEIWEALLEDMPMMAMVRNLGAMTTNGLLTPMSDSQKKVVDSLKNAEKIERSGAHPMQFLIAARQYSMGKGLRGSLSWEPNQKVLNALDSAYYASFGNVPVTGKNILVAVDTSGSMSMTWANNVMGIEGWSPLMAAAAMALVTLKVEPNAHLIGYDTDYHEFRAAASMDRIDEVVNHLNKHRGGGTNTALPVHYALDKKLKVDAIVSYTDNETWEGGYYHSHRRSGHVTEVLKSYTDKHGPIKFINCAITSTGTTDVDPKNTMMFELTGMDANTPLIIGEYVQGNL